MFRSQDLKFVIVLLLSASISLEAESAPDLTQNQMNCGAKTTADSLQPTLLEDLAKTHVAARYMLGQNKLLNAIWFLEENGCASIGRKLRVEVERVLRVGKIATKEPLPGKYGGANEKYLVTFEASEVLSPLQVKALFKPQRRDAAGTIIIGLADNWRSEVAAYELDKSLELNQVPITVDREIEGRQGSLQLWVTGATKATDFPEYHDGWESMKSNGLPYRNVTFFDRLISNYDRHGGNQALMIDQSLLETISGKEVLRTHKRMVLIDNDLGFENTELVDSQIPLEEAIPTSRTLEKFKKLTSEVIKERFGSILTEVQLEKLISTRNRILQAIERADTSRK